MSKEDLKVKPAEQDVKEEDLKEVNGGIDQDCPSLICTWYGICQPDWGK